MSDLWLPVAIAGAVGVIGFLYFLARRDESVVFADQREEGLTRRLAQSAGCSLKQARTFVQREIAIAPAQSDETLLKRAAYHYQQELPVTTCQVYRDRAPG